MIRNTYEFCSDKIGTKVRHFPFHSKQLLFRCAKIALRWIELFTSISDGSNHVVNNLGENSTEPYITGVGIEAKRSVETRECQNRSRRKLCLKGEVSWVPLPPSHERSYQNKAFCTAISRFGTFLSVLRVVEVEVVSGWASPLLCSDVSGS